MKENLVSTAMWDDMPIDITAEANHIWATSNKLRGVYMPDKYGDVIIPMTVIRRFECVLEKTKDEVIKAYRENPNLPDIVLCQISGKQFYNTSEYNLEKLADEPDYLVENFKLYIDSFSDNVRGILDQLDIKTHIDKMHKNRCLFNVVKSFSELDMSEENFDSMKMGYIFENLIGRFFQNVDAGQFYTGRDIIKMMVDVLTSEGCEDIRKPGRVIKILDQACGTGGMLSTSYNHIKHINKDANVMLYGQELMGQSYAVGLAEMLIKKQNADNFKHVDTLKEDCFRGIKMDFVLENPPFGTPWKGSNAKTGQEAAVLAEYEKGSYSRWPAGLPGGGDAQLIFMQSAVDKMDDDVGRAAIITNGSPLFNGGVASGESQTRRWLLENDLIEAIIAMPTEMFYNTGIATYVWVLSKNKREERQGKIQLIDASEIYHNLRKSLGNKRREFARDDREAIVKLYKDFEENDQCQIYDNEEFIYKEYTVMEPFQRSYKIDDERIENLEISGNLNSFYNPAMHKEILDKKETGEDLKKTEKRNLKKYEENKETYEKIFELLEANKSEDKYLRQKDFEPLLKDILKGLNLTNAVFNRVIDGLSKRDKDAQVEKDKKGRVVYDKDTKDTEIVNIREDIEAYMEREVLPHLPEAKAFFEEDLTLKNPRIKTGAEIPFTRYFYKYEAPRPSGDLAREFLELEDLVNERVHQLFREGQDD